jgi:hypothetical protein
MMTVNDEVRMWKKEVVANFKVPFRYLYGGIKENHKNFQPASGKRTEPWTSQIRRNTITSQPRNSVFSFLIPTSTSGGATVFHKQDPDVRVMVV